jgi:hypothetical protein
MPGWTGEQWWGGKDGIGRSSGPSC